MRKHLFMVTFFLMIALLISATFPVNVQADTTSGQCGDNLTWTFTDGTLTISGSGAMYDYSKSNGAPWSDIRRQSITKIVIEDGVQTLGNYCFQGLSWVESISFPETLEKIGEHSCDGYWGSSIELPSSLKQIGKSAFANSHLEEIVIPQGVETIPESCFWNSGNLKKVVLPSSVSEVEYKAFYYCWKLDEIVILSEQIHFGEYSIDSEEAMDIYTWSTELLIDDSVSESDRIIGYTNALETATRHELTGITTTAADVYDAPEGNITGSLSEGTYVVITEAEGNWYKLEDGTYISAENAYYAEAENNHRKIGSGTATKSVTVYELPSDYSASVTTLTAGTLKNVYSQSGNWYEVSVTVDGQQQYGWVRNDGFDYAETTTAEPVTSGTVTAQTSLYYGAGRDYSIFNAVAEGTRLDVYEIRNEGETLWYKVKVQGKYVWIDGNYFYDDATAAPAVADKIGQGTTTQKVTIYSGPNEGSEALGTIGAGKIRNLYAQSGNWYEIYAKINGESRFCWVRCDGFDFTKANRNASYATATVETTSSTYYGHGYDYVQAVTLNAGTKVNIYKEYEGWYLVYRTGKYLWINGENLKDITLK